MSLARHLILSFGWTDFLVDPLLLVPTVPYAGGWWLPSLEPVLIPVEGLLP